MSELELNKFFRTNNPCYKANQKYDVKGIMIHSLGVPQPKASVMMNKYNKATSTSCAHAFIDGTNGKVYQTLPWTCKGRHCEGSANNTHIGIEICEPEKITYVVGYKIEYKEEDLPSIKESIDMTYNSAVLLCANLCKMYNLDPTADGVIISHREGFGLGIASNRGDIDHLWDQTKSEHTMDTFRADVAKAMNEASKEGECISDDKEMSETEEKKVFYKIRKSSEDAESQIGAYEDLNKAKSICDLYTGYKVYGPNDKLIYPFADVPFRFQIKPNEKKLIIYKAPGGDSEKRDIKLGVGIFTIVDIQNGSSSKKGFGLLKAYRDRKNGWINLDDLKHILEED